MKRLILAMMMVSGLMITPWMAVAVVPQVVAYQGKLSNAVGSPVNGVVNITFNLYTLVSGGAPIWTETHTGVNVNKGLFKVNLGSLTPFPVGTFSTQVYLGVTVGADPEMTPRTILSSTPYALHADDADTLGGILAASVICHQGDYVNCYSGVVGTMNVGICKSGVRSCGSSGWRSVCTGEVVPVAEICGNGLDDNCNGVIDETGGGLWYLDADGDMFGDPGVSQRACTQPIGYVADSSDCDDADPRVYPGAPEICGNGVDDNCNGIIDEAGCI